LTPFFLIKGISFFNRTKDVIVGQRVPKGYKDTIPQKKQAITKQHLQVKKIKVSKGFDFQ
jgi:hypothetical protein